MPSADSARTAGARHAGAPEPAGQSQFPAPTTGPEHVALDQPFDRTGLYALRAAVSAHADQLGVPARVAEELVLIAHELASNAIRHGGGSGRLRLWRQAGQVYCEVVDHGSGLPESDGLGSRRPPVSTPGGRGLWIVHQLATRVAVDTGPAGTTVTAAIGTDHG